MPRDLFHHQHDREDPEGERLLARAWRRYAEAADKHLGTRFVRRLDRMNKAKEKETADVG